MTLFIEVDSPERDVAEVAGAQPRDVARRHRVDVPSGGFLRLIEASDTEAADILHNEALGLIADEGARGFIGSGYAPG